MTASIDRRYPAKSRHGLAFLERLRKLVSVKLMIKGIDTREDAASPSTWIRRRFGYRTTEAGRRKRAVGRSKRLPEVVAEVGNRIPVLSYGGFRPGPMFLRRWLWRPKAVDWPSRSCGV